MIARVGKKIKKSGGSSGFKYKKRSAESVKKRADQTGGNFDSPVKGVDMWRPKSGENVIRILPATWEDFDHYGYDVFMHRFIGSDSSNYICLNKMKGKKCPACIEQKAAKDAGEEDEAKALAYAKRCWVYIIDRDDKTETPQIWDMSWSQDRDIAGLSHFKSGKVLLIDHPDEGYDIIVKKTGSGLQTKYHFNIERDSSPISEDDDKQEEILNFIQDHPIPTVLNFFSAEHISKKLEGTTEERDDDLDDEDEESGKVRKAGKRRRDEEEDEDEDEDEKPVKKKKRKPADEDEDDEDETPRRRKKKPADDEDEDEEEEDSDDEDEDEEEEEEEERPRKKKKPVKPAKKKKRPADDEDEDDEDEDEEDDEDDEDDEEEEEERPRKKKVVKKKKPVKKRRARDEDEDEDDDD